jgi:Flp pilus assembly pilin Flp
LDAWSLEVVWVGGLVALAAGWLLAPLIGRALAYREVRAASARSGRDVAGRALVEYALMLALVVTVVVMCGTLLTSAAADTLGTASGGLGIAAGEASGQPGQAANPGCNSHAWGTCHGQNAGGNAGGKCHGS